MKRVVKLKLLTTEEQFTMLLETLQVANEAANYVAEYAYCNHLTRAKQFKTLQQATYSNTKNYGLSAQPALHVIKKVAHAYTSLAGNIKNGNYGPAGSKRRKKVESKPILFKKYSSQPYDDRCLSYQLDQQTISIWSVKGRIKNIKYIGRPIDLANLAKYRKGESDLIFYKGSFYLHATLDESAPDLIIPNSVLGVDLGIENIAFTSDNQFTSGKEVLERRTKNQKIRTQLQKKNTKSAKRRAKLRSGKESRFVRDVNHCISKKLVNLALRTDRAIALEVLTNIRDRVRLKKPQRVKLHSWAFAQLADFISYKAEQAGIPVYFVNPAYTSQKCSQCDYIAKKNRTSQESFTCHSCGTKLHADYNAAINIANLGAVNLPVYNAAYMQKPFADMNASLLL